MNDIMLDLETLDTRPTAAILSIGAVFFGQAGLGEEFYRTITLDSCTEAGLSVSGDTFMWWMGQKGEARKALFENPVPLAQALAEFTEWVHTKGKPGDTRVWGNGADFDNAILRHAYTKLGEPAPWKYYNSRCYRTACEMLNAPPRTQDGVHHNALDDAKSQARHLVSTRTLRAMW